ncbi:unnamed protein product [Bemisia tabaci]|uniref:Uncharacterized protein n=1 Tax=Bemisia tabaci TaxID=7038 RepID=A0A9P0F018_BEMTA|nr:unnamed protein product [Bemisia tabaci]
MYTKTVMYARILSQKSVDDLNSSDSDSDTLLCKNRTTSNQGSKKIPDPENSESSNSDVILTKKPRTSNKVSKEVINLESSDSDSFSPKKSRLSNSNQDFKKTLKLEDSSDSSESDIFLPRASSSSNSGHCQPKVMKAPSDPDGTWYFTDEFGITHKLVDVKSITSAGMKKPSIEEVIRSCTSKIKTSEITRITILRGSGESVLAQLRSDLKRIGPASSLHVKFHNERGMGNGPLKDMFSIAFQGMQESTFLEGDPYNKSLRYRFAGIQSGFYEDMGEIMVLSILHNGPYPVFLTPNLVSLILEKFDENTPLTINDVHNANVKAEIQSVMEATNCLAATQALADSHIFSAAGTYDQFSSENWQAEREIAVKG